MRPTHHSSTNNNYHSGGQSGHGGQSSYGGRDGQSGHGAGGNGAGGHRRKKKRMLSRKKRSLDPALVIDYKDPDLLRRFITERGKIIPRRISGATQEQQRKLTIAIKRARFLALLPCSISHENERGFSGEMQNTIQTFVSASMRGRGPGGHHRGGPGHTQDGPHGAPRGRSEENRGDFDDADEEEGI